MHDLKGKSSWYVKALGVAAVTAVLAAPVALAQPHASDQGGYHDRYYQWDEHGRLTRIGPGTEISVRTEERVDVNQFDNRVYPGRVENDVFGENGRLAIPRGAPVELMVRVAPDNDLVLDIESVTVHGDRLALDARPDRVQSERMHGIIGAIAGAAGVQVRGPAVDVPRDTVLNFRIERPLVVHAVHEHPYGQ
jgi:hypothetical protein